MDPNIILPPITDFVNEHYEVWDDAHPNQMWTNAQKAIVNNYIMNRINDVIEANEDEHLGIEEIQEIEEKGKEQDSDNIFKLFKRVQVPIAEQKENNQTNEDKILILQQDVKKINNKLDNILDLLNRIIVK